MTRMLASVNSLAEARLVLAAEVGIIDLKQPARGALGALSPDDVRQIVAELHGRCPISATVGDLPMQADIIYQAVMAMAETGVDFIKIGFFPGGDWLGIIQQLSTLTQSRALIAVLFADTEPDLSFVGSLKDAGFAGVMLDTMDKQSGSLLQVMATPAIADFVKRCKLHGLLCGLAGSLRQQDIPELLPYAADYLGFRGALCARHQRTAELDLAAIARIHLQINGVASQ